MGLGSSKIQGMVFIRSLRGVGLRSLQGYGLGCPIMVWGYSQGSYLHSEKGFTWVPMTVYQGAPQVYRTGAFPMAVGQDYLHAARLRDP